MSRSRGRKLLRTVERLRETRGISLQRRGHSGGHGLRPAGADPRRCRSTKTRSGGGCVSGVWLERSRQRLGCGSRRRNGVQFRKGFYFLSSHSLHAGQSGVCLEADWERLHEGREKTWKFKERTRHNQLSTLKHPATHSWPVRLRWVRSVHRGGRVLSGKRNS